MMPLQNEKHCVAHKAFYVQCVYCFNIRPPLDAKLCRVIKL